MTRSFKVQCTSSASGIFPSRDRDSMRTFMKWSLSDSGSVFRSSVIWNNNNKKECKQPLTQKCTLSKGCPIPIHYTTTVSNDGNRYWENGNNKIIILKWCLMYSHNIFRSSIKQSRVQSKIKLM